MKRINPTKRLSYATVYGGIVYLAGQTADDRTQDVRGQTQQTLSKIDWLLEEVGSNRARLLTVQIWLSDIRTFDEMNAVWDSWVDQESPPSRATVEARLATTQHLIEIGGSRHSSDGRVIPSHRPCLSDQ